MAYGNGLVRLDHANLLRGRPAPTTLNRGDDLNAIGRIGHRHGVVCLTLAKWETVSGQFGGYLTIMTSNTCACVRYFTYVTI